MVVSLVKIHQMELNNKPFNMIKNGRKILSLDFMTKNAESLILAMKLSLEILKMAKQ